MTRLKAHVTNPVKRLVDPDLPYVALEHIESGTGQLLPGIVLEGTDADDSIAHQPGDVRFGKLRPYLGKSFLATERGVGSGELIVLRPGADMNPRFLWYLTRSRSFVDWAVASSYGVKMPRTSWEALGQFDVRLPPLDEQQRIAEYLDSETRRIDQLSAEQARLTGLLLQHLESFRESLLVASDVRWTPLQHLVDPGRPIVYGIVQAGPECPDGVPYIKTGDVIDLQPERLSRTSPEIDKAYLRARVGPGDIVIAMRASIGQVTMVPETLPIANLTQGTARIAPASGVDGQWLLEVLRTRAVQEEARVRAVGTTFLTLNIGEIRKLSIPVPVDGALGARGKILALRNRATRALIKETQRQVGLLAERREALITAAVTGGFEATRGAA